MVERIKLEVITAEKRPDLLDEMSAVIDNAWPEFMMHDESANQYWKQLFQVFPKYQFAIIDTYSLSLAAVGNAVPLSWHGKWQALPNNGFDWAIKAGFEDLQAGREPTVLCGLSISVHKAYRGHGISRETTLAMLAMAKNNGFSTLVAPIRPNQKHLYPLTPMEDYLNWKDAEGMPFDPWLRTLIRLGGTIEKICPESIRVSGSVQEWEDWCGLALPAAGEYIVPDALVPLNVSGQNNLGVYIEPNVWMVYSLE